MPRPGPRRPILAVKVGQDDLDRLDRAVTPEWSRSDLARAVFGAFAAGGLEVVRGWCGTHGAWEQMARVTLPSDPAVGVRQDVWFCQETRQIVQGSDVAPPGTTSA